MAHSTNSFIHFLPTFTLSCWRCISYDTGAATFYSAATDATFATSGVFTSTFFTGVAVTAVATTATATFASAATGAAGTGAISAVFASADAAYLGAGGVKLAPDALAIFATALAISPSVKAALPPLAGMLRIPLIA